LRKRSYYLNARPSVAAFDTETYRGNVKVVTCSDGAWLEPSYPLQVLDFLWRHAREANFFFNIAFDAGAILKPFLADHAFEDGVLEVPPYTVRYVNGKGMSLKRRGKAYRYFFDISNFYHDGDGRYSLGDLSWAFLGEGKTDAAEGVERERIGTEEGYYEAHRGAVVRYSVQDSRLTARLAEYFIDSIHETLGIWPAFYYSVASVSKAWLDYYHPEHAADAARIPKYATRQVLRAYRGGIFLVRKLGRVAGAHEIDLNSAYPAAISQLRRVDPESVRVVRGLRRGDYSFHYARFRYSGLFPYRAGDSRVLYPVSAGKLRAWVTGPELDYLFSHRLAGPRDVLMSIVADALPEPAFPEIRELYEKRREVKAALKAAADPAEARKLNVRQWILKLILNALYGTFAQTRPHMSRYTNVFYAAYITALTRLRIWEAIDAVGEENVVSVQTDAIVYRGPGEVPESDGLGGWKYEFRDGEVITYMNGLAVRNGVLRKRGFPTLTAEKLLNAGGHTLAVERRRPVRLLEAVRQKRVEDISDFEVQRKEIDLRSVLKVGYVRDPERTLTFEYLRERAVDVLPLEVDGDEKALNAGGGSVDE